MDELNGDFNRICNDAKLRMNETKANGVRANM